MFGQRLGERQMLAPVGQTGVGSRANIGVGGLARSAFEQCDRLLMTGNTNLRRIFAIKVDSVQCTQLLQMHQVGWADVCTWRNSRTRSGVAQILSRLRVVFDHLLRECAHLAVTRCRDRQPTRFDLKLIRAGGKCKKLAVSCCNSSAGGSRCGRSTRCCAVGGGWRRSRWRCGVRRRRG